MHFCYRNQLKVYLAFGVATFPGYIIERDFFCSSVASQTLPKLFEPSGSLHSESLLSKVYLAFGVATFPGYIIERNFFVLQLSP